MESKNRMGIGHICVAICLTAAAAGCVAMVMIEREVDRLRREEVACEPVVDATEIAAVIEWARSGAGTWKAAAPAGDTPTPPPGALAAAGLAGEARIAVPETARAGGGRVSSIPGGALSGGGASGTMGQRSQFTRALNRSVAPSSTRSRRTNRPR